MLRGLFLKGSQMKIETLQIVASLIFLGLMIYTFITNIMFHNIPELMEL